MRKIYNFIISFIIGLNEAQAYLDNPNNYYLAKKSNKIVTIKSLGKEKKN